MPCYEDVSAREEYENKAKYGACATDRALFQHVMCEMGKLLEREDLLDELSDLSRGWYKDHRKFEK